MTRHVLVVTFGGQTMPLFEAAKLAGLSAYCVRKRWQKGDRGEQLFRPSMHGRFRKPPAQLDDLVAKREALKAAERAEQERRMSRQRREQEARRRAMVEHAKAFARPLIDAKLVKPNERLAIQERVKYCGQRNWSLKGLA